MTELLVVSFALLLRAVHNDIEKYAPNDERMMMTRADYINTSGLSYKQMVEEFMKDWRQSVTPSPIRYGYLYPLSWIFKITGPSERVMAWISTLSGVMTIYLVYLLTKHLYGESPAIIAAMLCIPSPLQMHLSRRALQDQLVCATTLGALWALLTGQPVVATVILTFHLMIKETGVMIYPALIAAKWFGVGLEWNDLWVFGLPPAIFALGFVALARSPKLLVGMAKAITNTKGYPYGVNHQSGPPHRLALDLFALSPLMCLMATQAGLTVPTLFALVLILTHGVMPAANNLRMATAIDPALRISAGVFLASLFFEYASPICYLIGLTELLVFYWVFEKYKVYDPVSESVYKALHMLPRIKGTRMEVAMQQHLDKQMKQISVPGLGSTERRC